MNTWIVIVAVGLGSYLFRLSMIILTDRITMPPSLPAFRRCEPELVRGSGV